MNKRFEIVFLFIILTVFFYMLVGSILSESRIFDEGLHVDAGYAFLTKQDFAKEPFNPPLARELVAIPSYFSPATLTDPIYFWQRMVVSLISCIFLILLYVVIRKLFGVLPAMFGVILFMFNPEILAHSHYAVTDLILSFFIFLSVMAYLLWKDTFTLLRLIILGVCIGLALSAKVSAVPFLLLTFLLFLGSEIYKRKSFCFMFLKQFLLSTSIVVICAAITLWATYFFTRESVMGEGFTPRNEVAKNVAAIPGVLYILSEPIPLGGYLRTIKQILLYNYSDIYSKPAFLLGDVSSKGFWYFYPIALVIKSPLPLLLLLSLSLVFIRKLSFKVLWLPVLAIIISSMMSTLNLGIRYILPIYPLVFIYLSQLLQPKIQFRYKYPIIIFLLAWYVAGTLTVYPHTLSFMNEFAGPQLRRHNVLLDSNYDWGQRLVALSRYQKENNIPNIQLAYFGMVNPTLYDISYVRIGGISHGDTKKTQAINIKKGSTIVISASCYYLCGYYKNSNFINKDPDVVIGGSLLVFRW